jgi:hypothetical protein
MIKSFTSTALFLWILLLAAKIQAQPTQAASLRLGALGGLSQQPWSAVGPSKMEPPAAAPLLGATAAWMRGRWSVGGEFYHTGLTRQAAGYSGQVSSFSSTLQLSYAIWQSGTWRAELSAGAGSLRQQLVLNSTSSSHSVDIRSNNFVWQPGIQLVRLSPKGLWWSVQTSYQGSFGRPEWKYSLAETNSDYKGLIRGWQLRFCTGGWIDLRGR